MNTFDWMNISSEEDLRKNYKYNEIYKKVLSDLKLENVISIKGYSNLFKFIVSQKKYWIMMKNFYII